MDAELDELFETLKKSQTTAKLPGQAEKSKTSDLGNDFDSDVVKLDSRKETEPVFEVIEKRLNKLPKLESSFDHSFESKAPQLKTIFDKESVYKSDEVPSTKKSDWFLLPKPDDRRRNEMQRDLLLIKHRAALDPKRHYKKEKWTVPERFAVGTIVEAAHEWHNGRLTNRERKSTILETLMQNEESSRYFKRKFTEIQKQKSSGKRGHYKAMKAKRHKGK